MSILPQSKSRHTPQKNPPFSGSLTPNKATLPGTLLAPTIKDHGTLLGMRVWADQGQAENCSTPGHL